MSSSATSCELGGLDGFTPYLVTCHVVICLTAIAGNSLVIVSIIRFSELRTPTNYFVAALALADLFVGIDVPYYVSFYFDVPYVCNPTACLGRYYTALWGTNASLLLLTGVAVDRYVSVLHPLQYPLWITTKASVIIICVIYAYVTLVASLPILWDPVLKDLSAMQECDLYYLVTPVYAALGVGLHVVLTLVSTTFLYARIFREAWRQKRVVAALHQAHLHQEAKTTLMMVLILGVSLLSLLPYLIVVAVRYLENEAADSQESRILSEAKKIVVVLYFGKSAVNPFIYGWKNRDFRSAFIRLLRNRCHR